MQSLGAQFYTLGDYYHGHTRRIIWAGMELEKNCAGHAESDTGIEGPPGKAHKRSPWQYTYRLWLIKIMESFIYYSWMN